jgi:hypothetical protein
MSMKRRRSLLGIVSLTVTAVAWPCAIASAEDSLFANDEILEIAISGPLRDLTKKNTAPAKATGHLQLADGTEIPMMFSKYGDSRLEVCDLPLFKIEIDQAGARGTPFQSHPTVRLVTPCHHGSDWDKYTLLEYLAYRSYAVLAEPALRVRLVSTRFLDSERPAFKEKGLSFFIEDIEDAAERYGMKWLDIKSQPISGLNLSQLALLGLFQYMVGNTDWSVVAGGEGERCCHNMAVLGSEDEPLKTLLPFDFDFSGLVAAPYATPNQKLPIHRVTQRWYRGFCASNTYLPATVDLLNEKRHEIERLFTDDRLPQPKARKRALKYIEASYGTINDPQRFDRRIIQQCR